jgi:hypothetical protein
MATATTLRVALGTEPQKGEQRAADALSHFAEEASAERANPGRGILWGLFLGGGLWMGIFELISLVKH